MKILVVEDTEDARVLLVDQLQINGYEVDFAVNGVEALEKARRSAPDLIVSDIMMPEMDGFELCRQIKRDPELRKIPFIFYSATYTGADDRRFAMSLGASRFVIKPEDPGRFMLIIKEVLSDHASGKLSIPDIPSSSDDVLEHMHSEALTKKLDKKVRELERQKKHLQLITDAMPVLMSDISADCNYQYVNQSYENWYHMSREDIVGKPVQDIIGREAFEIIKPHINRALKGESVTFESHFPIPAEADKYILARYIPHKDEYGEVTGFFELVSDITERKKSEQELILHREHLEDMVAKRTRQLFASYKELEAFCYSVSHDLRSPLRSVSGFCQLLSEDYTSKLDETGKDYLAHINKSVIHMGSLIDDLLSLSQVTSCELTQEKVDLSQIAKDVVEVMRQNYSGRNVECIIRKNLIVSGDKALLRVVLENLFDNAWKFTANKQSPRIEFGAREEKGKQVFFIRDNGIGFNMDRADKLFGAFQRLHDREKFPGTGIGLASVKRIILRHGGDIWAESKPGKGTTFSFTLAALQKNTSGQDMQPQTADSIE